MDFQKPVMTTSRGFTFVASFGENFTSDRWRYGGLVALTGTGYLAIALQLLEFLFSDFQLAFAGLNFGRFTLRTMMDMDLG